MRTVGFGLFWSQLSWLAAVLIGVSSNRLMATSARGPGPMVGKRAPEFQIQGPFDESYSLKTFKGHILVMQFGASW